MTDQLGLELQERIRLDMRVKIRSVPNATYLGLLGKEGLVIGRVDGLWVVEYTDSGGQPQRTSCTSKQLEVLE